MEINTNQKPCYKVNYPYDALEPDKLTLRPGDILREVERLPGGWLRGELHGRRGMFPDHVVSVLADQHYAWHEEVQREDPEEVTGWCKALYSYEPANPDELHLFVGDVLEVVKEVEEGWWHGRLGEEEGVFPSNFVVMLDQPPEEFAFNETEPRLPSVSPFPSAGPLPLAPALPPKPVREQCRVLFPYTAVNEDELTIAEGDIVNILSKNEVDRGWWRGELHGKTGLFPDNFVKLLPSVAQDVEEKKPEQPPGKTNSLYPILNKYIEKIVPGKELITSKVSTHKEYTLSKESTVTHTNKTETEKIVYGEPVGDKIQDEKVKKPPVPLKKSPTPTSGVGGLFSGLKNKMLSSSDKTEKSSALVSNVVPSSVEWDRTDGSASSKPNASANATANANANSNVNANSNSNVNANSNATANSNASNTFDHIQRNSILNDPRAGRVKAPRRRPRSQVLRDDTPGEQIGLTNGHEVPTEKPSTENTEKVRPRTREWEKHRAPWMEELKLNQAKKTSFGIEGKSRSVSTSSECSSSVASKAGGRSTDRILDCGLEEKRPSHSMDMSKSTSSISNRISVLECLESSLESKTRQSGEQKNTSTERPPDLPTSKPPPLHSPNTGRTLSAMTEEIKKPPAPSPPTVSTRTVDEITDKSPNKQEKQKQTPIDKQEVVSVSKFSNIVEKSSSSSSSTEKSEEKTLSSGSLERRIQPIAEKPAEICDGGSEALITQLNYRILNLEKLIEVQNAKFNAAIEDLTERLKQESERRQAMQLEIEKLVHFVTQV